MAKAGPGWEQVVVTVAEAVPLEAHAPKPPDAVRVTLNDAGKLAPGRVHTTETLELGATAKKTNRGEAGKGSGVGCGVVVLGTDYNKRMCHA